VFYDYKNGVLEDNEFVKILESEGVEWSDIHEIVRGAVDSIDIKIVRGNKEFPRYEAVSNVMDSHIYASLLLRKNIVGRSGGWFVGYVWTTSVLLANLVVSGKVEGRNYNLIPRPDGYGVVGDVKDLIAQGARVGLFWINDDGDKIYVDVGSIVDLTEENITRRLYVGPNYAHCEVDIEFLKHKRGRVEFSGNTISIGVPEGTSDALIKKIKDRFFINANELHQYGVVVDDPIYNEHWGGVEWVAPGVEYK